MDELELSTLLDPLSSFDSNDPYYMDPQNVLVPATDDDDDLDSDDVLYTDALESSFTDDYDEDDDDDDDDNDPFLDLDDDDDEALKDAQGVQYMESSSTPEPTTPNNQPQQPRSLSSSPLLGTQLVYPPSKQELQQQQLQQQQLQQQQQQQQQQEQQTHHNQYNEKVIRLSECPICHRPNLSRRAQMDIVTHVATCAANDWTTVDRFLMGNFITEQYAQRK
jgi:phosphatidylserine decarboxylase